VLHRLVAGGKTLRIPQEKAEKRRRRSIRKMGRMGVFQKRLTAPGAGKEFKQAQVKPLAQPVASRS